MLAWQAVQLQASCPDSIFPHPTLLLLLHFHVQNWGHESQVLNR